MCFIGAAAQQGQCMILQVRPCPFKTDEGCFPSDAISSGWLDCALSRDPQAAHYFMGPIMFEKLLYEWQQQKRWHEAADGLLCALSHVFCDAVDFPGLVWTYFLAAKDLLPEDATHSPKMRRLTVLLALFLRLVCTNLSLPTLHADFHRELAFVTLLAYSCNCCSGQGLGRIFKDWTTSTWQVVFTQLYITPHSQSNSTCYGKLWPCCARVVQNTPNSPPCLSGLSWQPKM